MTEPTQLGEALAEIRRLRDRLAEQDRAVAALRATQEHFWHAVSHEVRTPLQMIQGYVDVLRSLAPGERLSHYLRIISNETDRLAWAVEDLAQMNDLEHGNLTFVQERVELEPVVLAATRACQERAPDSILRTAWHDGFPWVDADPVRVRQSLDTLLRNAVRLSPDGADVMVVVLLDRRGRVGVRVEDHGPTIPEELRATLFERVARVPTGPGPRLGPGLGLYVIREFAARMGGALTGEARDGGGNAFTLWLRGGTE